MASAQDPSAQDPPFKFSGAAHPQGVSEISFSSSSDTAPKGARPWEELAEGKKKAHEGHEDLLMGTMDRPSGGGAVCHSMVSKGVEFTWATVVASAALGREVVVH